MIGYPVMRSVFLLLVSFCVALSTAQLPQPFRVQSSSEQLRNALVVPTSGGDTVYVGSSTSLYSLNQTLSLQAVFTPLSSFNAMLLDVEQADRLLACQSDRCLLLNATSLQNNQSVGNPTPARLLLVSGEDNEVVLISSDSTSAMFFVGKATSPNGGDPLVSAISKFSLTLTGSPAIRTVANLDENSVFLARSFFTSFHKNGFVYFVFSIVIQQERQIRIARICSNDAGTSDGGLSTYSEVLLNCADNGGSPLSGTYYAATIHDEEDDARVLLALHQAPQAISYICSYNLSAIDAIMEDALTKCTNGTGTLNLIRRGTQSCPTGLTESQKSVITSCYRLGQFSLPIEVATPFSGSVVVSLGNSQPFHSLLLTTVSGSTFIYAGSNGKLEQFYLNQTSSSARYIRNVTLNSQRNVTELHSSSNGEFVYAPTSNELFRHQVDVCSDEHTCSDCLVSHNLICGWCSLSNSCTRQMNCPSGPWLQGEVNHCPTIHRVEPSLVYVNQLSQGGIPLSLSVSNIPQGTQYQCVFAFVGSVAPHVTMATVINSTQVTCMSPTVGELPVFSLGQDTHFVSLSLRTNDNQVNVVTIAGETFGFTNCSVLTSCFMCLQGHQQCQWCPSQRTCNPPQEACTISLQGQPESSCSFIEGPGGSTSNYLVHTSVNQTLSVRARNLDLFSSMPLQCKLTSQDGIINITIPAVWKSQASQVKCQSHNFMHHLNGMVPTISLELEIQVLSSIILSIANPNNIRVVLYQCSYLATECSSCLAQRMDTDFQCGWCGSTCVDVSDTCSAPSSFITVSSNCPAPMISSVSPDSGPTSGGTTVNITGTNLGTSFSDLISIRVGSLTCTPRVNSYMVGRRITCDIENGSSSQTQAGSVDVVVTVRRMGGADGTATAQFRFGLPRVYSVSPSFGPVAGGTMVRVRGEDLNIGNTERTTVSLVTTPVGSGRRRRRRQTMGSVSCNIMTIAANEITCVWSNFTASMSGVVQVTVDSAVVQNQTVTYQYLNNPVYEGLTPQQTIRAGGIRLTFTGQYLNVSQQPTLQFNIGPNAVNSTCQVDSSGTSLEFLAPPLTELNNYTVIMDAAPGPDTSDNDFSLVLVDNPEVRGISEESRRVDLGMNSTITIEGQRINNVDKEEITVMVGQDQCVVQTTGATIITCVAPQRNEPVIETVIVMFGLNLNSTPLMLQYANQASIPIAAVAGGVAGGVIVLLLIFILIILVPIIYCYYSSISKYKDELERAQQPVYTFVPEQPGITMTDNVGYQSSAGLHVPALNPAYTKSSEPDHLYEKLPEDLAREEKEASATDGGGDDYYVNDDLHPGSEKNTEQHSVGATNGMRFRSKDDDAEYYVNDDLVPEDAKLRSRIGNAVVKECKENDDYYANDDLFPEKVKKELQPDDQKKNSANDCDYYVNDDLVPENTKGKIESAEQAKEKDKENHSNHGDQSMNQLTDAEEGKEKGKEGSRRNDVDEDGYLHVNA